MKCKTQIEFCGSNRIFNNCANFNYYIRFIWFSWISISLKYKHRFICLHNNHDWLIHIVVLHIRKYSDFSVTFTTFLLNWIDVLIFLKNNVPVSILALQRLFCIFSKRKCFLQSITKILGNDLSIRDWGLSL